MTSHFVAATPQMLHGYFSRELAPVLEIKSGDSVRFQTLDAVWNQIEQADSFGEPQKFELIDSDGAQGHCLTGPIAIEGARPGMTLEVRIQNIVPARWGWTSAGGYDSPFNQRLGIVDSPRCELRWSLDEAAGLARNQHGRTIRMRPFMGVMGMPPAEPGIHPTRPPRATGGNIDCKELIVGSTLYLPIAVEGGLFSVGDGHAVQGDGEVAGPAIECPMEQVELEFHLHPEMALTLPRAHTPAGWITFGFHEDMNQAWMIALEQMITLMQELHGLEKQEALALASLLVDLRITQVVNGVVGVHAILPHGALDGV